MSGVLKNDSAISGGILLNDFDVLMLRKKRIDNYINWQEIWSLKYGNEALALSNVLTNFSINQFYRKQFHLQNARNNMGIVSSLLMTTVVPTAAAASAVTLYFSMNLLKASQDECLTCREIRTIMIHMGLGTVLPTLVSWHGNLLQAEAYKTYRVPNSRHFFESKLRGAYMKQTKEIWHKTNKHALGIVGAQWATQLVLCSFLLFMQRKHFTEKIEPIEFSQAEIQQVLRENKR